MVILIDSVRRVAITSGQPYSRSPTNPVIDLTSQGDTLHSRRRLLQDLELFLQSRILETFVWRFSVVKVSYSSLFSKIILDDSLPLIRVSRGNQRVCSVWVEMFYAFLGNFQPIIFIKVRNYANTHTQLWYL